MPAATSRRISMKALARYHVILLGEQRHIRCEQLAQLPQLKPPVTSVDVLSGVSHVSCLFKSFPDNVGPVWAMNICL